LVQVAEALHRLVVAHVVRALIQPVVVIVHARYRVVLLDLECGRQGRRRGLLRLIHHWLHAVEVLIRSIMLYSIILLVARHSELKSWWNHLGVHRLVHLGPLLAYWGLLARALLLNLLRMALTLLAFVRRIVSGLFVGTTGVLSVL
jgi:hypothetical protein